VLPGVAVLSNTLSVTINSNLRAALSSVLSQTLNDGVVSVNLSTGHIGVDLNALTGGLNHLPPNSQVLTSAVLTDLVARIGALLAGLQSQLLTTVTTVLDAVSVTISGGVCLLQVVVCTAGLDIGYNGTLGGLISGASTLTVTGTGLLSLVGPVLTTVLTALQSVLATLTGPIVTTGLGSVTAAAGPALSTLSSALDPVLTLIHSVLALIANVQEPGSTAGSYREVALRAEVGSGSIATVDLGRAEVAALTLAAPATTTSTPSAGSTPGSSTPGSPGSPGTRINSGLGAPAAADAAHFGTGSGTGHGGAALSATVWTMLGLLLLLLAAVVAALTRRTLRRVSGYRL